MPDKRSEFAGDGDPRKYEDAYAAERRRMFADIDQGVEAPITKEKDHEQR